MYTDFPNHNFTKHTNCALASLAVDSVDDNTIGVIRYVYS